MKLLKNGNWGLKLLALALAIVIYHVLKTETVQTDPHDTAPLFQPR